MTEHGWTFIGGFIGGILATVAVLVYPWDGIR
jgi:uncharacterized membrane protein YdcZ (DUF606 family)